jgi:hypothetical protein
MGGIYGSAAFFIVVPEEDIAVAVVVNVGGVNVTLFAEYMTHQFLDMCFGFSPIDWVQKDIERKVYYQQQQDTFYKELKERNPTPRRPNIEDYVGVYSSDMYGDIKITYEHGNLMLSNGIRTTKLQHLNRDIFEFPNKSLMLCAFDANETVEFSSDDYGEISSVRISCCNEGQTFFVRKEPDKSLAS